ncbi:c-type cytochrome [Roseivivax sp. CAU 1761]
MRLLITFLALAATAASATETNAPPNASDGGEVYQRLCSACHGASAKGDGYFAELLTKRPPDLTAISERNGGAFPTFEVMRKIDGRSLVLAHGLLMPAFGPELDAEPAFGRTWTGQTVLTSRGIADVTAYLESIQNQR